MFTTNARAGMALMLLAGCTAEPEPLTAADRVCESMEMPPGDSSATLTQRTGVHRLNCHRAIAGLAAVELEAPLDVAAQAHAEYLTEVRELTHRQADPGVPGYLGEWPQDRVEASGAAFAPEVDVVSEVLSWVDYGADPSFAVDQWMSNVYRREPLMHPRLAGAGFGSRGQYDVMVVRGPWASDGGLRMARYPASAQWGVPTSFHSDAEDPDPMPDHGTVGYPVSLSFLPEVVVDGAIDLQVRVALSRITDAEGTAVRTRLLQPSNDPRLLRSAFLVPEQPLQPNTRYDVRFVGTLDGEDFEETWSFTTGIE
jgi:uncharacterized protein YkwD